MGNDGAAPVLAIDGPSGAGKGTVAQEVATRLGWHYLDSGALYRVLALAARERGLGPEEAGALRALAAALDVVFVPRPGDVVGVRLDGRDVSGEIRSEEAGRAASRLAAVPEVREGLLALQRRLRRPPGLVAEGRDMGTVVFPDAAVKIYLTASPEVRAQRRYKQLKEKGLDVTLSRLVEDIQARDRHDTERAVAPLRPAEDALVLDSSTLDVEQVVARVLDAVRRRQGAAAGGGRA